MNRFLLNPNPDRTINKNWSILETKQCISYMLKCLNECTSTSLSIKNGIFWLWKLANSSLHEFAQEPAAMRLCCLCIWCKARWRGIFQLQDMLEDVITPVTASERNVACLSIIFPQRTNFVDVGGQNLNNPKLTDQIFKIKTKHIGLSCTLSL